MTKENVKEVKYWLSFYRKIDDETALKRAIKKVFPLEYEAKLQEWEA